MIEMMNPRARTYLFDDGVFHASVGIPLTDRGFRYGMSIFETIAIRDSKLLLLDSHLARLTETARDAKLQPPAGWLDSAQALLTRPPIAEGVARLYITAGDHDEAPARVALIFESMTISTVLSRARAVTVEFAPALPFGKTGNYWPHFLARLSGGEEAILCSPAGLLLGGAMSNLFVLIDGRLLTPSQPVRRGIVRAWIGAEEADLTRDDLAAVSAAFLTNSRIGMRQLTAIDGRDLADDARIEAIWQRYRTEVLHAG